MADREFTSLIPRISPSVPGCPQPTIVQSIQAAAIRMCELTLAWRHVEPRFDLQPGVPEYHYRKPPNTDVHALFEATLNNYPLDKLTLENALDLYPQWVDLYSGLTAEQVWQNAESNAFNSDTYNTQPFNGASNPIQIPEEALEHATVPRALCQITPDKYIVLPLPDDENPYTMRMFYALKPKRTSTGMDEVILSELEDIIVHATLETLLVLPDSSWTDRELAAYHGRKALAYSVERRARANLGNQRATATVRMMPWA